MEENNNQYQQQPAPAPQYQNPVKFEDNAPLTIGNYLVMMIVGAIPVVGLIMTIIWAFGNSNVNKKNYARALLIMMVIGIVLSVIFGAAIFGAIASLGNSVY